MSRARGNHFEDLAARFITAQGLRVIARNWQCKQGELDLIAQDGPVLVFIEVRARSRATFGDAASSITLSKQGKLIKAAQAYLSTLPYTPACRFDAILMDGENPPRWLQHIIETE